MPKNDQCLPRDAGSWSEGRSIGKEEFQRGIRKLLGVIDMFTLLTVIMVSQLHIYVKTSNYTLYLHFIICQLHLNKADKNHIKNQISRQHDIKLLKTLKFRI